MFQQLTALAPFSTTRRWIDENWLLLMRLGIISGVLMTSAVLATRPRLLYLVGLAGLAALILFMRSPGLGVLLTLLGGMVIPFYGPSGVGLTQAGIVLLIGLWVLDMLIIDRRIALKPSDINLPALLLVASMILSFAIGKLPWYRTSQAPLDAQLGGVSVYVLSIGAMLFVGNRLKDERWLFWLSWAFVALAWLRTLGWLSPTLGRLFIERMFAGGSLGSLFYLWLVCIPLAHVLFNKKITNPVRVLLLFAGLSSLYVMTWAGYNWKSGWMPAAAGMVTLVILRFGRLAPLFALAGVFPIIQAVTGAVAGDRYSYSTRLDAWTIVLEIVKANPITGLGPANYYWYTPLFPIRGYAVNFNSHSQYIDIIAQTGIIGFVIFFWLIWKLAKLAWSLKDRVPDGFAKGYVYCGLAGIVGTLVAAWLGDWVLPFVYNVGLLGFRSSILSWLFFGGLLLLDRMYPALEPKLA